MPEVLLRRRSGLVLAPADGLAEVELGHFPMGRDLICTLKMPRSNVHNRLYWACLHRVAENLDQAITARALHEWLKLKLGYATPIALRSGAVEWVADSTAFDRMDQAEFNKYTERAFAMIKVGFGIDPEDIKREGAELLGHQSDTPQAENAGTVASTAPDHGYSPAPAAAQTDSPGTATQSGGARDAVADGSQAGAASRNLSGGAR
jgi:hypothetical protein